MGTCVFVLLLLISTFITFCSKNVACVLYALCNLLILCKFIYGLHMPNFFFLMFHGFLTKDIIFVHRVLCFIHLIQSAL